jgi:hypothetical protein
MTALTSQLLQNLPYTTAADPEIWALHPVTNRHTEPVFRVFGEGAIASGSAFSFVDRQCARLSDQAATTPITGHPEIG